jgi:hypothetical protein
VVELEEETAALDEDSRRPKMRSSSTVEKLDGARVFPCAVATGVDEAMAASDNAVGTAGL